MCPCVGSHLQVPQWGLQSQAEPQTPTDVRETVDRLPSPAVATGCRFCLRPALSPPVPPCPLELRAACPPGQRADLAVGHLPAPAVCVGRLLSVASSKFFISSSPFQFSNDLFIYVFRNNIQ